MLEVSCTSCNKVYGTPEEKIPSGQTISFRCPNCAATITIDPPDEAEVFEIHDIPDAMKPQHVTGKALEDHILKALGDLPIMPEIVPKVQEIMANPNAIIDDLARVIETDQGSAAMVLKLTNSAYYGLRGEVSSIKQAGVLLGFETLGKFILMAGASTLLDRGLKGYAVESGSLWGHSLKVAFMSKLLAKQCEPSMVNDAFLAGLIHDIGKVILDDHVVKKRGAFERFMQDEAQTFVQAEQEVLGLDHAQLGFSACANWNFPDSLTIPIKYHHAPPTGKANKLTHIVYTANAMALLKDNLRQGGDIPDTVLDHQVINCLGFKKENLGPILEDAEQAVDDLTAQLGAV